ncbi:phosphonate metabolism ATP-binding protein PhnN [Octadecabacter arcticus 238]|jgi:ribose 1,5-bisphosphokinase|uniref:Ribose 1,5-bisphosphate phosphokinase PhnN n=1 Tax=Octadecabacter arcticus 238 TaxID=391616 RepID=M9RMM1_9RHOB|nr:phosphonate metabolism protein/1,5-bisphosphokinase (PRPP-forming) PhnN [Octadecabacter arcticus]AGI73864.1 phosphonate metabolism ATP-binding protein PhnN [Octadecabacter arcticus 238]
MRGRFIAVIGPSGVGKDSVMEALAASDPRFTLARRVITRPSDAGGEAFEGVNEAEFHRRADAEDFALHWPAHGLHYGIPRSVDEVLAQGNDVLANLSRAVLADAMTRFERFEVINLTASRGVLAARLAARGRETPDQISARLDRVALPLPAGLCVHAIDNSCTLEQTVQDIRARLYPVRA